MASSGLTILETTIGRYMRWHYNSIVNCYLWYPGNSNKELWQYVSPQGAVLEGVRATVANRLAGDGDSWTSIFSRWLQLLSNIQP